MRFRRGCSMSAISLLIFAAIYAIGVAQLWARAGVGRGITRWQAATFACGWLALVVALSPPLDEWSETWLVAHMLQHELLMAVAAPLLAASAPLIALSWATPASIRRRSLDAIGRRPFRVTWSTLTAPASVFLIHAVALWVWHLPALYDLALAH